MPVIFKIAYILPENWHACEICRQRRMWRAPPGVLRRQPHRRLTSNAEMTLDTARLEACATSAHLAQQPAVSQASHFPTGNAISGQQRGQY
jgi:hypothetical protein